VLGGIRRHRMETRCGCRGRALLVLPSNKHNHILKCRFLLLHRLKLVTGVEISTRLVRTSGSEGKVVNRRSRIAAADPKSSALCLSIFGVRYVISDRPCLFLSTCEMHAKETSVSESSSSRSPAVGDVAVRALNYH